MEAFIAFALFLIANLLHQVIQRPVILAMMRALEEENTIKRIEAENQLLDKKMLALDAGLEETSGED